MGKWWLEPVWSLWRELEASCYHECRLVAVFHQKRGLVVVLEVGDRAVEVQLATETAKAKVFAVVGEIDGADVMED